jgi:hypothetical protein
MGNLLLSAKLNLLVKTLYLTESNTAFRPVNLWYLDLKLYELMYNDISEMLTYVKTNTVSRKKMEIKCNLF